MVGAPKHLGDLRRIEADVRVICRQCGYEDDWTVDALSAHLFATGGSLVWDQITRTLRCQRHGCGSPRLRLLPVPYARRTANLPRQVSTLNAGLLVAAIAVLEEAAAKPPGRPLATIEVRLALLVTYGFARDRAAARLFWERAGRVDRPVDQTLREPLAVIRHRLEERGWLAREVLLAPVRTWPWNGPAPPGWRSGGD